MGAVRPQLISGTRGESNSKPLHNISHPYPHPAPSGPGSFTGTRGDDMERVEGAENQDKSAQRPWTEMSKEEINSN